MVCPGSCSMLSDTWTSLGGLEERPEPLSQSHFPSLLRTACSADNDSATWSRFGCRCDPVQLDCLTHSQSQFSSGILRTDGRIMLLLFHLCFCT
jgi:hypothetical protein